jgi:hypothetical protein
MRIRSMWAFARSRSGWALVLAGVLGGAAGHFVTSRRTCACSCADFDWRVVRQSVTSSDAAANHLVFWPVAGNLTSFRTSARITTDTLVVGVISTVEAWQ